MTAINVVVVALRVGLSTKGSDVIDALAARTVADDDLIGQFNNRNNSYEHKS